MYIDIEQAKRSFAEYVSHYDRKDPKIQLKLRHTMLVMETCGYLADSLHLKGDDHRLALLIGLLHDIGRFEQLTETGSYDDTLLSHTACGLDILFPEHSEVPLIRNLSHNRSLPASAIPFFSMEAFVLGRKYDSLIYTAIKNHGQFAVDEGLDEDVLLYSRLIRDADKLDNFRVKSEDSIEAMLEMSGEELGGHPITDSIYETFLSCRPIVYADRQTPMDFWLSFIAYIFDLNFPASFSYVLEHGFLERMVNRIPYSHSQTRERMQTVLDTAVRYCHSQSGQR